MWEMGRGYQHTLLKAIVFVYGYAVSFCYMHEIMMERFTRFLLGAF